MKDIAETEVLTASNTAAVILDNGNGNYEQAKREAELFLKDPGLAVRMSKYKQENGLGLPKESTIIEPHQPDVLDLVADCITEISCAVVNKARKDMETTAKAVIAIGQASENMGNAVTKFLNQCLGR